jgi:hypothetical protein
MENNYDRLESACTQLSSCILGHASLALPLKVVHLFWKLLSSAHAAYMKDQEYYNIRSRFTWNKGVYIPPPLQVRKCISVTDLQRTADCPRIRLPRNVQMGM